MWRRALHGGHMPTHIQKNSQVIIKWASSSAAADCPITRAHLGRTVTQPGEYLVMCRPSRAHALRTEHMPMQIWITPRSQIPK